MDNIHDFALEIEYNAKLVEYREWEVEAQKPHLTTEELIYLEAKGITLEYECNQAMQKIRAKRTVTHTEGYLGFDTEPQQLAPGKL
jgi:hypothetical protein